LSAPPGLILAAPSSGSGKTTIALGLMRALARRGLRIAAAKIGPDYIDPGFHRVATGRPCLNLDPWAMRAQSRAGLASELASDADLIVCEGVMGLFDGIDAVGTGSSATLAAETGWPVLLVVDAKGLAASFGPLVAGFAKADPAVRIVGAIANRTGRTSHVELLRQALAQRCPDVEFLGGIGRDTALALPERHLGLVPAGETPDIERFVDRAADACAAALDLDAIMRLARPSRLAAAPPATLLAPLGQHIAVASDAAFAFAYPAQLAAWRRQGAEISFFSPLADESPAAGADAVFLPGGYPELHAGKLASASLFLSALRAFKGFVYGECGGYMALGDGLVDADGARHAMLGLLPVETTFAKRKLQLGYRKVRLRVDLPFGKAGMSFRGHEFHYSAVLAENRPERLFDPCDAAGHALDSCGARRGNVAGSYIHLIDQDGP
jgi:cobyrinic acid a,c-diamide synthase